MQKAHQMLVFLCGGVLAIGIAWPMGSAIAAETVFRVPAGERQLFLDGVGVAKIENLTHTMHPGAKKGAVILPDLTLSRSGLQIRSAPLWIPEQKVFKFMIVDTAGPSTCRWFTSVDGLHWESGEKPSRGMYMVIYDGDDPIPARRYKTVVPNKGVAISSDGIKWSMVPGSTGVPTGDEQNLSLDVRNRQFILTVKRGGPHGRSVGLATSEDFDHWTDHGLVFHADDEDQKLARENIKARLADVTLEPIRYNDPARYGVDVYNMGLFRYEGLYIGMPAMFHSTGPIPGYPNTDGFHLVQLACSRDMKTWKRLGDRKPFIGPSRRDSGASDLTQILGPSDAIVRGDELWFYYTGLKYRAAGSDYAAGKWSRRPGSDRDCGAVCLAVLRRDGFVSLDAAQTGGTVLTEPFKVPAGKLFVNVNALKGELRVEALGAQGEVLARSAPMKGDLPRGEVRWETGDIAKLKGRVVSLRFKLHDGEFYSYWFGK